MRTLRRWVPLLGLLLAAPALSHAQDAAPATGSPTPAELSALDTVYFDPSPATGTSTAVIPGDTPLAFTSLILPLSLEGGEHAPGNATEQARRVLQLIAFALKEAETGLPQIIKLTVDLAEERDRANVERVIAETFAESAKPAITWVVGRLPHPNALVGMDAVATTSYLTGREIARLTSPAIYHAPDSAHVAVLPVGSRVFLSSQSAKGKDTIAAGRSTMEALERDLRYLNLGFENVVALRAFLKPGTDARDLEYDWARFFPGGKVPPITFIQSESADPVEIDLIAAGGTARRGAPPVEYPSPDISKRSPVYSRIVQVNSGRLIFLSGMYGGYNLNAGAQIEEIFRDMEYILGRNRSSLHSLVRATAFVQDAPSSNAINDLRQQIYDPEKPPTAAKALVSGVARDGHTLEIEMIAVATR